MIGRRNIIIAVTAIVVFAALVGFFITLDVSPQIAYARLFIDAGLAIGLIAVVMAFYKEKVLPTDSVINALRSLINKKYSTRISTNDLGQLTSIGALINELADSLEQLCQKQEEIKRNLREELLPTLKQKEPISLEHSYHPELGPVDTIAVSKIIKPTESGYDFHDVKPMPINSKTTVTNDSKLNNTLIASKPPELEASKEEKLIDPLQYEQDISELYDRFIYAQKTFNIEQIEYALFLKTIQKTKEELMSSYKCHGILFDIVEESNQVALQPKIIR